MHKQFGKRRIIGRILLIVVIGLILYAVLPQLSGLRQSWQTVGDANRPLLGASLLLLAATYLVSTFTYRLLAFSQLRFYPTALVQIACGLAGKLLPAGLGSIGLNAVYLRKHKHSLSQASVVVGMNNLVGFVGYALILLLSVFTVGVARPHIHLALRTAYIVAGCLAVAALLALLFFRGKMRSWLTNAAADLVTNLRAYRKKPIQLFAATGLSCLQPLLFTSILLCCARAVGADISLAVAFAAFSASMLVGTITPTPGGVLGAEAGLTAALTACGLPAHQALVIALLYRIVTYWLPMVPGAVALLMARKRYV